MFKLHKPAAVVTVTALAVVLSAGTAYAYWTVSGSGTATATVATVKPLTVEQVNVKDLALGRPADLTGKVSNPNDFEATLLGTTITVKVSVDRDHQGCNLANFEVVAPSTKAELIKANDSVKLDKGSITLLNTREDQVACQGATLTLDYLLR